jgi:probable rRNA maturation factor
VHKEHSSIDVRTTVRTARLSLPFEKIARKVLGPDYSLSVVVCGNTLAQRINRDYRHKTYVPNVLSFPLDKSEGEIFLNLRKAEQEARTYGISVRARAAYLFIHGLCHLSGLQHGATMESIEHSVMHDFGFAE